MAHQHNTTTHQAAASHIILFSLGILLFWAAMYVYTPVFPVYASVLGASMSTIGLAVGTYGLTQMLLRIPLGVWSDALGKRRIFVVAGMLVCAGGAVGFAFSPSPFWLVIFRGVMGVAAASWVCSTVLFTSYFPGRHPSLPLSIMTFAQSLGLIVAATTGGEIAQRFGWIAPFWASCALAILAALVLSQVPDDTTARAMPVTREGMARTLRSSSLIFACLLGVIMQFVGWSTVNGFMPVLAAERFAATRAQLGYLQTVGLIAYSLLTIITPRLVVRAGEVRSLGLSLALLTVGILPTPLVSGLGGLMLLQVFNGAGRGLIYPLLLSLSIKMTAPQDRASAMGIFQAVYALGMFVGPWLSGFVAESVGLDAVFIMCGLLSAICLPLVALTREETT